jgi:hypothetical protein
MEAMEVKETIIDEGDEEGGWVETQFEQDPTVTATQEKVADMSLDGKVCCRPVNSIQII